MKSISDRINSQKNKIRFLKQRIMRLEEQKHREQCLLRELEADKEAK